MSQDKRKFDRKAQAWLELASRDFAGGPSGVAINVKWTPKLSDAARRMVADGYMVMRRSGGQPRTATVKRQGKRTSILYPTDAGILHLARLRLRHGAMSQSKARTIVEGENRHERA